KLGGTEQPVSIDSPPRHACSAACHPFEPGDFGMAPPPLLPDRRQFLAGPATSLSVLLPAVDGAAADQPALAVRNRTAAPDEWGYRPAAGAVVRLNPPSWTWLLEPEAGTYTVEWARGADFAG